MEILYIDIKRPNGKKNLIPEAKPKKTKILPETENIPFNSDTKRRKMRFIQFKEYIINSICG